LYSPALAGQKLNLPGLKKLQKSPANGAFRRRCSFEQSGHLPACADEKLTPKEKAGLVAATAMPKVRVDLWQKIDARSKKLEKDLKSANSRSLRIFMELYRKPRRSTVVSVVVFLAACGTGPTADYSAKVPAAAQEIRIAM